MDSKIIIGKVMEKREFSQLPLADVEKAFSHFEKRQVSDAEKVRLTRELLHKVFGAFGGRKLFSLKEKEPDWFLRKHLSTRERLPFYGDVYGRIFEGIGKKFSVIDLGAGINGLSYGYFEKRGFNVNYVAIEAIGQFVDLMKDYFSREKIPGEAIHLSLFEIEKVVKVLKNQRRPRVALMFKVVDSLEMLDRDYSQRLLLEISKFSERVVLSFATRSMISRKRFRADRGWIFNFIHDNFKVLDDFEIGSERFVVFRKRE
ncbi:MAG: hypothetical protein Q8P81_01630 [Nanoarchaeota archaeon]|nr:hypothetical protein [Nanoarchaeota archaeon]